MKTNIHPNWNPKTTVVCACGNTFTVGSTQDKIEVDVCSACHPFFTGQMKYIDAAGRVDAFKARQEKAKDKVLSKSEKRQLKKQRKIEAELNRPATLEELRARLSKSKK